MWPPATAYTVYGLNVVSTLCSYFLITRRLMYTCTQQGYRCTQIDFCCNVLTSLAKIAVSLWFANYVLYFSVTNFLQCHGQPAHCAAVQKGLPLCA